MDPDEILKKIRELSAKIIEMRDKFDDSNPNDTLNTIANLAEELAKANRALDNWLCTWGNYPDDWVYCK